eukprot:5178565-Pleurochrysis_carterae.AAC.1
MQRFVCIFSKRQGRLDCRSFDWSGAINAAFRQLQGASSTVPIMRVLSLIFRQFRSQIETSVSPIETRCLMVASCCPVHTPICHSNRSGKRASARARARAFARAWVAYTASPCDCARSQERRERHGRNQACWKRQYEII